jgi:phospholipid/cholesterol/gamma-HCH transport system substrate-binding protein
MDMQQRQVRQPLYGGLLIAGIFAVAVLIFFLDDIVAAFDRTYAVVALVPDAPGLGPGSPVWVGGKLVGEVRRLGFMPSHADTLDRIWVRLRLPKHVQSQVRADSRVRVTSTSLIGEAVVDILPGTTAAPVLAEGDTLRIRARPTAAGVKRRAGVVRAQLDTLLIQVGELAPVARARMEAMQRSFAGLAAAQAELERMRSDLQANPGAALLRDPAFQASLERAQQHASEIPAMVGRLQAQYGQGGEIGPALAQLQARADTLRAQLVAAEAMLAGTDGFLPRSARDDALRNAVQAARIAVDSLIAEASSNPLRFVF